jgi:hypothetical protein
MIKIEFHQEPYYYEHAGGQEYDINTTIKLNSDISSTDAILAFAKLLQIATYNITPDTLRAAADQLEDEGF